MRRALRFLLVVVCTVGAPAAAWAQASLAGTVKDPSGAVLPGVTVEATSPALIEKVRAAVTDGTGQYRIEDLRPGSYEVTFALPGFNTLKRAGILLSGAQIANVSVELRVGALEETVTVTGEAPVVDVRSTRREMTLSNDTIRSIPSVRSYSALLMTVPGVQTDRNNVATGPLIAIAPIHGGRSLESRLYRPKAPTSDRLAESARAVSRVGRSPAHSACSSREPSTGNASGSLISVSRRSWASAGLAPPSVSTSTTS
jgi:hypothetical protein